MNLITHVAVEKACEHDSNALIQAIEDTEQQGLKPKTILADTLYGGDDNSELAKTQNVELVSPTFKKDNNRGLSCFIHSVINNCAYYCAEFPIHGHLVKRTCIYIGRCV